MAPGSSSWTSWRSSTSTAYGGPELFGSTELLRRQNAALVLRCLRQGPATRAELAKRTGLAKATVGAIVGDLEPWLRIEEEAVLSGGRGRPGRPVALARGAVVGVGLELNVDYVAVVALDLSGDPLRVEVRPRVSGGGASLDPLLDLAGEVLADLGSDPVVAGLTLAVPGLVGRDERTVAWAPNVGWEGEELVTRLEAMRDDVMGRTGQGQPRVEVLNDANCAALAEVRHGAAQDAGEAGDAIYLTGTVGIGAGIVHGGQLLTGGTGFAGEVGHMPMGLTDAVCGCGRAGCWEASVGLHAMLRAVGSDVLDTPIRSGESAALRADAEPAVRRALADLGSDLGFGLATLANVLDPDVIVLGGYFVPLGDLVVAPARAVLAERLVPTNRRPPDLRLGRLGIHAAATGAAERSLDGVLSGRSWLPVS